MGGAVKVSVVSTSPHVCSNEHGGARCDICFGLIPPKLHACADKNAAPQSPPQTPKRYLPSDSGARKRMPMCSGLLDYFPDACAAVAEVSWLGNEKHNPGEPLHWARGKSMDHADCIVRHLEERGGFDVIVINGVEHQVRHSAALAWRALALLQEELEQEFGLSLPRGAWLPSR